MIITSVDGVFEDIFDISGDVIHDNFIDEDGFDNFLDSRLDVDSVLIDDIKLEHDSNSDQNSDHSHQSNEFFQNHDGKGNQKAFLMAVNWWLSKNKQVNDHH